MADKSLFARLNRLFSTNLIVRNVGGRRLKVADTSRIQSSCNLASIYMVDRWAKLHKGSGYGSGAQQTNYTVARRVLFDDYEGMDQDPILSSALDIYADECTVRNEFGNILEVNRCKHLRVDIAYILKLAEDMLLLQKAKHFYLN